MYVVCVVADMHLAVQVDVFDPLQTAISTQFTPPHDATPSSIHINFLPLTACFEGLYSRV